MNSLALINQPPHFYGALVTVLSFVLAIFSNSESIKKIAHTVLYIGNIVMIASGVYLFINLPFSVFVLIKSVGGLGLIAMAEVLIREKAGAYKLIIWTLLLLTASAGLTIAYFFI